MPPALIALAPVVAAGVKAVVKHKQAKSAEKKQAAYDLTQATAAEDANKAQWEAQQNSPEAAMKRLKYNTGMSKVLGQFGGRDKTPAFMLSGLDSARKRQAYTPGAAYVAKPESGAGGWDIAAGAADALSYLDTSKLKGGGEGGGQGGGIDLSGLRGAAPASSPAFQGAALPSQIGAQQFRLGETNAADEFLRRK